MIRVIRVIRVILVTIALYDGDIKALLSKDVIFSDQPAVWKHATVYPLGLVICSCDTLAVLYCGVVFKLLSDRSEMLSGNSLKSVSESGQVALFI